MDETSLTDFLGESAEGEESEESEESVETVDERSKNDTNATISTYGWTPDGTACESCGETVNRRWRDDEQFVCADCKSW